MRTLAPSASLAVLALVLGAGRARADRPDTPGTTELFRYDATDVIETFGSPGGSFLVHYTRAGSNAVPLLDTTGTIGVPDHVERVAEIYDSVLAFYQTELGYRAPLVDDAIPDNGGDGRFDVYLLDFGGSADGAFRTDACGIGAALPGQCVGFMVQENDFAAYGYPTVDYANRLLASHELFHAVQAAYDSTEGSVLGEGTAVWASEAFDPGLHDLEGFAGGYYEHTDRPIDRPLPGPIDPFSYGASIFFRFLEERFDRGLLRELWEACDEDAWMSALDVLLLGRGSSFSAAFGEFVQWNLFTDDRADPAQSYANGADYPRVTITPVTLPHQASPLRVFYASSQYYGASPGGRDTIEAALVGDAAGLGILLATRRGSTITLVAGSTVDAPLADEVIVIVVNTAPSGDSRRPGLCIGDPDEVVACVAALDPVPDAGVVTEDSGTSALDAGTPSPPPSTGCACTLGARTTSSAWLLLAAAIAITCWSRAMRRRAARRVGRAHTRL